MRATIVACWMLAAQPAAGQEPPAAKVLERQGPATLSGHLPMVDGQATIAFTDQIILTIEVSGDESLQVRPPKDWTEAPWNTARAERPRETRSEGRVRWSQMIRVEPLAPGEQSLQLAPLQVREAGGGWRKIVWKPLTIRVQARLAEADSGKLRDITSIEELPARDARSRWGWIGAAAAAVILLAAALVWARRRRAAGGMRSAEAWALHELERLEALRLPERGKAERFGALLTALVRRYLERRFDVPARRQTTAEFLAAITQTPALQPEAAWLEAFFTRCDQIKFAPIEASQGECAGLAARVREFLGAARPSGPPVA